MSSLRILLLASLVSCGGGSPTTEGGSGPSVSKASTAIPNACDLLTEAIAAEVLGVPVNNYSNVDFGDQRSTCAYSPLGDKHGKDSIKLGIAPLSYTGITLDDWKRYPNEELLGPRTIKPFGDYASSTSKMLHLLTIFRDGALYELTANPIEDVEGMTSESMTDQAAELIFGANTP